MPLVGDVLADRYRVVGPLGAGGMASVWRARDLRLGRDVAVKVLLPNLSADSATAARFDREARSLAAAAHPSVVAVYDVEPGDPATGREPFYVMELCDAGSLADRLASTGRLPPHEVASILREVAGGLADMHGRGMVHRDVKPHNILFCDGHPKLADFGLARTEGDGLDALTATGATIGTLAYLAPEQLAGAPATPASDVHALGVVAFQALTGRLPRPATSVTDVVEARGKPAATVSQAAPELGTRFDAVLAAALSADPADRPTPEALADAIAAAATAPEAGAPAPGVVPAAAVGAAVAAAARPVVHDPALRTPAASPTSATTPMPAAADGSSRRSRPALAAVALAVVVLAALLAANELFGGRRAGTTGEPGSNPPVAATDAPQPTVPPTQTPPVAAPTAEAPDTERALAAVADFEARLAEAEAGGLDAEVVGDLGQRAREVEALLVAGDLPAARDRAEELERQVKDLRGNRGEGGGGDDDDEDEDDGGGNANELIDPLLDAARALREAIPEG